MKDYSGYGRPDYVKWSANKLWQVQIQQEGRDVKIDDVDYQTIIRNYGKEMDESKEERLMIMAKDVPVKCGSCVYDISADYKYLVTTDIDKDNPFYNECKLARLPHILKFVNNKNGILSEYELPIIGVIKSVGSDSMSEGKLVNVLTSILTITCQDNEVSQLLVTDKRIIFDHKPWDIVDSIGTNKGLFTITCKQGKFDNVYDDIPNQIADRFKPIDKSGGGSVPTPIPSPTEPTVTYEIASNSTYGFDIKKFNIYTFSIVKKINDVIDNTASFNISLDYNSNPNTIATLTPVDGKSCKVKNNTGISGEKLYLKFEDLASGTITNKEIKLVR